MDKQLIKNLVNANFRRSPEMDGNVCKGATVNVFSIEGETSICKMWNSSNNNPFNKREACQEIVNAILEGDDVAEGHFSLDFNEIWFEISEK